MRYFIFIFLFTTSLSAQDTFVKLYDLDATGGGFFNSLVFEDTLVLYGTVKSEDGTQWGVAWVQCDTSGNIIQQKNHFDILGDDYSLNNGYEIIKTSDGGYAMVGSLFSRKRGFFMKLDVNGNLEFAKEYVDNNINVAFQDKVLEREDGYIIIGNGQMINDYRRDAYVIKTDAEGNELWKIYFGAEGIDDVLSSVHDEGEGEILLIGQRSTGASITSPGTTYPHPDDALTHFISIRINENTGDIISEEVGVDKEMMNNNDSDVRHQMYRDEVGNFVHTGIVFSYFSIPEDPLPFVYTQLQIVKRDTDFNVVWETKIGNPSYRSRYLDITSTLDGGWLATGVYYEKPEPDTLGNYFAGVLSKVNELGEFQWTRTDTFFYASDLEANRIEHTLNSVLTLPSGSIITTGRIENYNDPSRSYGWMIKLDKDGCLTPGCHPNLTGVNFSNLLTSFELFPNPTSDYVTVEGSGAFSTEVYDSIGRRVLDRQAFVDSGTLDFSLLPKGVYFVNIQTEGHLILSKKVSKL